MIFSNCPVCTVFERVIDDETRLESYVPHYYHDAYAETKTGSQTTTKSGEKPRDSLLILLDGELEYLPKPGDIAAAAELAELPERRFTVYEVFDARYGTRTPHIEVRAV